MSENKIEIKSLTIKIGNKTFDLSIDEARKLKSLLEEIFDSSIILQLQPYPNKQMERPYPYNPIPMWCNTDTGTERPFYTITCSNNSENNLLCEAK